MLDPNDRYVYLEALKPPDGYLFGEAVATTYSLDLTTLLSVPVSLTLPHLDASRNTPQHALDLLQALRQVSSRLTIFCDPGSITAPPPDLIYSLLEPVIVQARAPHGGSLHSKLWVIRFDPAPDEDLNPWMRLVVLSRNLTEDRSWDVSVMLDGDLGAKRKANNPVVQLLEKLPSYALHPVSDAARARVARLAEQVGRTTWELPDGFDELAFHVLGVGPKAKSWVPEPSDRLVVMSPFVSDSALLSLLDSTRQPAALVSRTEELARCDGEVVHRFESVLVLDQNASREDGEDTSDDGAPDRRRDLHAKAYIAKRGSRTHLYLGSANATTTALTAGRSIELLVELSGLTKTVPGKGIDGLLAASGFGALLVPYARPATLIDADPAAEQADEALRHATHALACAGLSLRFDTHGTEHLPVIVARAPLALHGVEQARAWLITSDASSARSIDGLFRGEPVQLATCVTACATAFVGFELWAAAAPKCKQFVLNLPTTFMPADRDAQIVRLVVKNQDRLMQYILGLLQGFDPFVRMGLEAKGHAGRVAVAASDSIFGAGLLEHLVRTKARHPERLDDVRAVLKSLTATAEGREMVPAELMSLWKTVTGEVLE